MFLMKFPCMPLKLGPYVSDSMLLSFSVPSALKFDPFLCAIFGFLSILLQNRVMSISLHIREIFKNKKKSKMLSAGRDRTCGVLRSRKHCLIQCLSPLGHKKTWLHILFIYNRFCRIKSLHLRGNCLSFIAIWIARFSVVSNKTFVFLIICLAFWRYHLLFS